MTSDADKSRFSRLLIVDDDTNQLRTLTRVFEAEGCDVVACSTGAEALEHLHSRDVGVAIVDLRLPDLTGTELLSELEASCGLAQVIIHTAYGSFESAKEAVNLGAFAYVEKGSDPNELIHHVHRAFRSRLEEYTTHLEAAVTERTRELQQANEALRKEAADHRRTEDAYRTLVDNSLQGLLMLQDERPVFANQAMAEILGCTIDEILAMSGEESRERIHPEDRERVWSNYHQRLAGSTPPPHYEHRIVRGNGEVRWLEIFASKTDFNGRPAIQTAYVDITERKQGEEAIRQSEARYRAIVDDQTEYLCRFRPDGTLTFVNRAICKALGRTPEELIGQSITPYVHPDDLATVMERLAMLTQESPVQTHENRNVLPTGEILWGQWTNRGVFGEEGKLVEIQSVGLDITERKQAERALRDSEALYSSLVETLPLNINRKDLHGRITFANKKYCELKNRTFDELIGKTVFDLFPRELADRYHRDNQMVIETRQVLERIEEYRTLDGTTRVMQAVKSPVYDANGVVVGVQGVFWDVTERKRMEAKLRQRDNELAHLGRLHTMGEMAAGLAHELNQPLYAITNYVTGITLRLREAEVDRQSLAEMMLKISGQARRASEIIKRLRNTVQKCEPRRSSTDLNELLRDVLPLVEHELRQENVSVHLDLQEGLPLVLADAIQIQQVALNLIRNALDAMRDGPSRPRQLTLTTVAADGEAVEVRVGDSGKGLSEELRHQVFDAFFTKKANGLGMGLAISRTIVETHEGRIWVTPNTPHGCVFRFVVPTTASKG